MNQVASKIMGFVIVINLAIGLFIHIGNGVYNTEVQYNSNLASDELEILDESIGSSPVEDSSNFGEKILDFFSLGLYSKAKSLINVLLYSLPIMLKNVGLIDYTIMTLLNTFLTFVYLAGIYEIFTGKSLIGG